MNKHFASLLLSAALAVSCLAVPAFAAEDEQNTAAAESEAIVSTVFQTVLGKTDEAPAIEEEEAAEQSETEQLPAEDAANESMNIQDEEQPESELPASEQSNSEDTPPADEAPSAMDDTAEEGHRFTYVALGDSITAGNGLSDFQYGPAAIGVDVEPNFKGYSPDCFVSVVADNLGLDRDHAINLGLPALMSGDLLDLLQTGAMPEMNQPAGTYYVYPQFLEYVAQADVITLQIGTNDAFVPFVVSIGNATNWKSEQFANSLVIGAFRTMDSEARALLKESLSKRKLTDEEKSALMYAITDGMKECTNQGYEEVTTNLPQIIAAIRALNPDVEIIILGYYNPTPAWMLSTWRSYFSRLNSYTKQLAEDEGLIYVKTSWTSTKNDMHPSIKGHKKLAKKITKAIEGTPVYAEYYG